MLKSKLQRNYICSNKL